MIGRKKEIQELNDIMESNKSEFVAIYGRRRVGKTFLINEVYRNNIVFRHTGLPPIIDMSDNSGNKLKRQLESFSNSLYEYKMIDKRKKIKSWLEAFDLLREGIDKNYNSHRIVLFIDEMPWMDTPKSYFLEAFTNFWNNYCTHMNNIVLVVCGSASSWILNNVIHSKGGLYGRITHQIQLLPFNLKECEEFLIENGINYSRYEIAEAYMSLGGIPYYLGYLNKRLSLAQNLDCLFFNKNAILANEFNELFSSQFTTPEKYRKIVEVLGEKNIGYKLNEIIEKINVSSNGSLYEIIRALEKSAFIISYIPFGGKNKDKRYKLIDPFCLFYLKQVKNNLGNDNYWQSNIENQKIVTWRGLAFENLCFNHIANIKKQMGISGIASSDSMWYLIDDSDRNAPIDLILNRKDNVVNLCEIKFYNNELVLNKDMHLNLMNKANALSRFVNKRSSIQKVLITTFGLKNSQYLSDFSNVIVLDDLFE